jgi:membrane protein implicated in regulation of membrane protease activity
VAAFEAAGESWHSPRVRRSVRSRPDRRQVRAAGDVFESTRVYRSAQAIIDGVLLVIAIVAALFWLPPAWGIAAVIAAGAFELAEIGVWIWYSKRRQATTGAEGLVGAVGVAVTPLDSEGQVRVEGELWRAVSAERVERGERVVVEGLEGGLTLVVSPLHSSRG